MVLLLASESDGRTGGNGGNRGPLLVSTTVAGSAASGVDHARPNLRASSLAQAAAGWKPAVRRCGERWRSTWSCRNRSLFSPLAPVKTRRQVAGDGGRTGGNGGNRGPLLVSTTVAGSARLDLKTRRLSFWRHTFLPDVTAAVDAHPVHDAGDDVHPLPVGPGINAMTQGRKDAKSFRACTR